MSDFGRVTIAGAGPGDPGLITVAAAHALARADVVIFDALANPLLLRGTKPGAILIDAGKRSGDHALSQTEIETLIVTHARAGLHVLRLKGGDPFVFGRGGEEALACAHADIPFTIIPGVTSAIAGPAYAGIPVTHRGMARSFLVLTGDETSGGMDEDRWRNAVSVETVVILMGAATLEVNMGALMAAGKPGSTPAACIEWGTHARQRVITAEVATIARVASEARIGSPMVVVVGEVVRLAEEIGWRTVGPLAGRRIVVTRARDQSSGLVALLEGLGAEVIQAPVIQTTLITPNSELSAEIEALATGGWMVFRSVHGVEAVFAAIHAADRDTRALAPFRFAAIGKATTAALARFGIRADFVPSRATGEALGTELPLNGTPVLVIGSNLRNEELERVLRARGAGVTTIAGYVTQESPLNEETLNRVLGADAITFTSSSTVANLARALNGRELPRETRLLSIGPKTSAAVRDTFGTLSGEAREATIAALSATAVEELAWD